MKKEYDYLIVGSGLFGSTFAHEAMKRGREITFSECIIPSGSGEYKRGIYLSPNPSAPGSYKAGTCLQIHTTIHFYQCFGTGTVYALNPVLFQLYVRIIFSAPNSRFTLISNTVCTILNNIFQHCHGVPRIQCNGGLRTRSAYLLNHPMQMRATLKCTFMVCAPQCFPPRNKILGLHNRLFWNNVYSSLKMFSICPSTATRCDSVSGKCLFRGRRCHPLAG